MNVLLLPEAVPLLVVFVAVVAVVLCGAVVEALVADAADSRADANRGRALATPPTFTELLRRIDEHPEERTLHRGFAAGPGPRHADPHETQVVIVGERVVPR